MQAKFDEAQKLWTITVDIDIDMYSVPDFKSLVYKCIDESESDFLIDCNNMDYIDSTGLGVLVSSFFKVKEYEGNIKVVGLKPHILKVFKITGLQNVFDLEGA